MAELEILCCGKSCTQPGFLDLRGLLSFWLVWELRLGPLNGAQLSDRLAWRRGTAPSPGTLYPALAALEKAELVAKRTRGRETQYTLSARGRRDLECGVDCLAAVFQDVVSSRGSRRTR